MKTFYQFVEAHRLKVWLDDIRPMPEPFDTHVKTAKEAIDLLKTGNVEMISLDHDLGEPQNGTGYDVAKWIEEQAFYGTLSRVRYMLHTDNSEGRRFMTLALQNAMKYWKQHEEKS